MVNMVDTSLMHARVNVQRMEMLHAACKQDNWTWHDDGVATMVVQIGGRTRTVHVAYKMHDKQWHAEIPWTCQIGQAATLEQALYLVGAWFVDIQAKPVV